MHYDEFKDREAQLLSLAAKGKAGDADAVNELYKLAQTALIRDYKQHRSKGRTVNKKKKYQIMLWAISAARKQITDCGHFNLRQLTSDTLTLAELENTYFPERAVRQVIMQNINSIVSFAKTDAK